MLFSSLGGPEQRRCTAGAIDAGRLLQLPGELTEKRLHIPDGKRQGEGTIDQNKSQQRIAQIQVPHDDIVRQGQQHGGEHPGIQNAHFQLLAAPDPIAGHAVAGADGQDHAHNRGADRNNDTIAEIGQKFGFIQNVDIVLQRERRGHDLIDIIDLAGGLQRSQQHIQKRHDGGKGDQCDKHIDHHVRGLSFYFHPINPPLLRSAWYRQTCTGQ